MSRSCGMPLFSWIDQEKPLVRSNPAAATRSPVLQPNELAFREFFLLQYKPEGSTPNVIPISWCAGLSSLWPGGCFPKYLAFYSDC